MYLGLRKYHTWGFQNSSRAGFEIAPMVLPFILPPFTDFLGQSESSVQTHMEYTYSLFASFRVKNWSTTQTEMAALHISYVIKNLNFITSKGHYIQRLYIWLIRYGYQVLFVTYHQYKILNLHLGSCPPNL